VNCTRNEVITMAQTAKLVITCVNGEGKDIKFSYNKADPDTEQADAQAVATALITNGSIFADPPVSAKAIAIVVTTTTDIPLPA